MVILNDFLVLKLLKSLMFIGIMVTNYEFNDFLARKLLKGFMFIDIMITNYEFNDFLVKKLLKSLKGLIRFIRSPFICIPRKIGFSFF